MTDNPPREVQTDEDGQPSSPTGDECSAPGAGIPSADVAPCDTPALVARLVELCLRRDWFFRATPREVEVQRIWPHTIHYRLFLDQSPDAELRRIIDILQETP